MEKRKVRLEFGLPQQEGNLTEECDATESARVPNWKRDFGRDFGLQEERN